MLSKYICTCFLALAAASLAVSAQEGKYFDIDLTTKAFEMALADKEALSLVHYVEGFQEMRKFLTNTGPIFRLVDTDVDTKLKTLNHMMQHPSKNAAEADAYRSIKSAIEFEVERNLVKDHRGPAVCRILSRLQWALEYLSAFMMQLSKMPHSEDSSYAAREIYDRTLGTHHSWAVRLIVNLALRTLPTKKNLVKSVIGKHEGITDEVIDLKITKLAFVTDKLWRAVEKIYADNNLTGL